MAARYRWLAVAAIWCLLFEWWCTASATVLSQGVGSMEIRYLERVDVRELPDSGVVWTKEVQALRVKKSYAAALSTTKVQSWSGWTQPKPNSSSQVSQQLQQVAAQLQSVCGNDPAQPSQSLDVPVVEFSGSGEVIRQIKQVEKALSSLDVDAPALESARKMLEQQLTELKTQQKAQQPLSKRLESARSALHRAQSRADPRSSENSSRTLHARTRSSQSSYRSRRRTPSRPLLGYHRQHHFRITQSWSANTTSGAGTISSLHSHQWSARVMRGCGSGDGCRRARRPDKASQDEEIARYKISQTGKEIPTVTQALEISCSHHTQRRASSPHRKTHSRYRSTIDQIDRDMNLHGCHVLGEQESCIKGNVTREQQNFVAYTSGANGRGQLGVEAWVHRSALMRARVRTEPCSPRLLVLKIDGRKINLTVIVAHAPPNDSGEQGRKSFWSSLRKAAKAVPRARRLALLIDANGRVGSPKSRFIGSCPGDVKNANGSEFRRALEERNLFAVSTFTPVYQPTWWSGRAQHRGRRIDCVAVSTDWTDDTAKPTTLPAIKLPGESVDHVPVRASMLWPHFSSGDQKSISRKHDSLVLDPWLINCPDARSWFQHYTSACIPTLLSLAQRGLVDEMYSVAHSALHRCATSCFGTQKLSPKPRKPWTSQRTVAMSVWTGPARHQLHRFRRVLKLVNVKCIMLAWRNAIGAAGRVLDALRERLEFSWSTRIRSLPGGDATGLSSCTDRRRGGLSWPSWPANTPYIFSLREETNGPAHVA